MKKLPEALKQPEVQLVTQAKELTIDFCPISQTYRYQKSWHKLGEDTLEHLIKKQLVFQTFAEVLDITVFVSDEPLVDTQAKIVVTANYESQELTQEYDYSYTVNFTEAPFVSKEKGGNYFQGILQIRNPSPELLEYVHNAITAKQGVFTSKTITVPNGLDLYLSDNTFIRSLALTIQKLYCVNVMFTSTLHSFDHQKSKELHRLTAMIYCFSCAKGDILEYKHQFYKVKQVQKKAHLINIFSDEQLKISAEESIEAVILKPREIEIVSNSGQLLVLHPVTLETVEVVSIKGITTSKNTALDKTITAYVLGEKVVCA